MTACSKEMSIMANCVICGSKTQLQVEDKVMCLVCCTQAGVTEATEVVEVNEAEPPKPIHLVPSLASK